MTLLPKDLLKDVLALQRDLRHSKREYVDACRRMLALVKSVDLTFESLYEGPALERALWRYEAMWLPLVAGVALGGNDKDKKVGGGSNTVFGRKVEDVIMKNFGRGGLKLERDELVPPVDIAWVWYVHRLCPKIYQRDMKRVMMESSEDLSVAEEDDDEVTEVDMEGLWGVDLGLNNMFNFSDGEDAQSKRVKRLWKLLYPYESFVPKYLLNRSFEADSAHQRKAITSFANEKARESFQSMITYDIMNCAKLQTAFLYQLIDENEPEKEIEYESDDFLSMSFDRYLLFLKLHKKMKEENNDMLLVPMKDISLVWHMHLACPVIYHADCHAICGFLVPHDPNEVDKLRQKQVAELKDKETENEDEDYAELEDEEIALLLEKKRRGISIKETKDFWEKEYGATPRYDLPDTKYRGNPPGDRGGFKLVFEKTNGSSREVSWHETLALMVLSSWIVLGGIWLTLYTLWRTLRTHGMYLGGAPVGLLVIGLGIYLFVSIPMSRPLSSDSRYWLERRFKLTHDALPPYLVHTGRKIRGLD
eukprot:Plantae.Rhodophyta-Hildenbrandia_rubra.ctg16447.p1 GENE.Plantae.Rhodophyta-Hildenbrandia_rubra.ctg16447~~Plantae.Rhodophyta-Hildenbrandia_rubra.ctg16447.p1  ORF type:complete len:534 (+),score=101.54 Plantae.Rhodophyta-Hildenbrandia_rubra.ctg16447:349-1950(+)